MVTKEIKLSYIDTGRLNRNLVSKEVAISWYKCRLQNMLPDDTFKEATTKGVSHFEEKFLRFIDSVIPQMYQYILVNDKLLKCSERTTDTILKSIVSVDDLCIGTNAAYISLKTSMQQSVIHHEHYLNSLSEYHETAIPIKVDDKVIATLGLFSKDKISDYDIIKIKDALLKYQQNETFKIEQEKSIIHESESIKLNDYFALPDLEMSNLEQTVQKLIMSKLPILIIGAEGTGKTTLSMLLCLKKEKVPFILNYLEMPLMLQKSLTELAVSQYDTVVFENIEYCTRETLALLSVYTDRIIENKTRTETSNLKDLSVILTTGYSFNKNSISTKNIKGLSSLIDKLKFTTVNLVNTNAYKDDYKHLLRDMLSKNRLKCRDSEFIKLIQLSQSMTFKQIQSCINQASVDLEEGLIVGFAEPIKNKIKTLETCEKEHILETLKYCEGNMTTAAEMLGIGRATLYRKLQKYQNETYEI